MNENLNNTSNTSTQLSTASISADTNANSNNISANLNDYLLSSHLKLPLLATNSSTPVFNHDTSSLLTTKTLNKSIKQDNKLAKTQLTNNSSIKSQFPNNAIISNKMQQLVNNNNNNNNNEFDKYRQGSYNNSKFGSGNPKKEAKMNKNYLQDVHQNHHHALGHPFKIGSNGAIDSLNLTTPLSSSSPNVAASSNSSSPQSSQQQLSSIQSQLLNGNLAAVAAAAASAYPNLAPYFPPTLPPLTGIPPQSSSPSALTNPLKNPLLSATQAPQSSNATTNPALLAASSFYSAYLAAAAATSNSNNNSNNRNNNNSSNNNNNNPYLSYLQALTQYPMAGLPQQQQLMQNQIPNDFFLALAAASGFGSLANQSQQINQNPISSLLMFENKNELIKASGNNQDGNTRSGGSQGSVKQQAINRKSRSRSRSPMFNNASSTHTNTNQAKSSKLHKHVDKLAASAFQIKQKKFETKSENSEIFEANFVKNEQNKRKEKQKRSNDDELKDIENVSKRKKLSLSEEPLDLSLKQVIKQDDEIGNNESEVDNVYNDSYADYENYDEADADDTQNDGDDEEIDSCNSNNIRQYKKLNKKENLNENYKSIAFTVDKILSTSSNLKKFNSNNVTLSTATTTTTSSSSSSPLQVSPLSLAVTPSKENSHQKKIDEQYVNDEQDLDDEYEMEEGEIKKDTVMHDEQFSPKSIVSSSSSFNTENSDLNNNESYSCNYCDKNFKNFTKFKYHMSSKHKGKFFYFILLY